MGKLTEDYATAPTPAWFDWLYFRGCLTPLLLVAGVALLLVGMWAGGQWVQGTMVCFAP